MQTGIRRRAIAACLVMAMAGLTLCSVVSATAEASSKKTETLQILVTNDDGVGAPGINASVTALTALPDTKVTVVAPLTNQSGTGAKVTAGTLTVTNATTASGYPAKAVAGYPADTIIWAIDDHGISQRPIWSFRESTLARTLVRWPLSPGQSERRRLLWPVASPPSPSAKASITASRPNFLRCQVSGGLGAIAPQGPSHRQQEHGQQHEWQAQRAHMRQGTHSRAGERGYRHIAFRVHDLHRELLQHRHQTVHRRAGLRGRVRFHLRNSSGESSLVSVPWLGVTLPVCWLPGFVRK